MHLVIIGGGPAGIAAALEGARLGAQVTLVERDHVGGRATWHSLLPSKAWLTAADRLAGRPAARRMGLGVGGTAHDFTKLIAYIDALKRSTGAIYDRWLADAGVRVVAGTASLAGAAHVQVETDGETDVLAADAILIATGSGPIFLPEVKPDGKSILAPRLMSKQTAIPQSLIMIGGGVTGLEFAYMYTLLGTQVTLVTDQPAILPSVDDDIKAVLAASLEARGMVIRTRSPVMTAQGGRGRVTVTLQNGEPLAAEKAFIAIGRRPHLDGLNLPAAGLDGSSGTLTIDGYGRTPIPGIYAAGDVTGPPMTANKGMAQGTIAARHALGAPVQPYRAETVVEAVYTGPEVAQVGLTEAAAQAAGRAVRVIRRPFDANLKAHLLGQSEGVLKLLIDPESGALLGGAAVGMHAVDTMAPLAVALAGHATVHDLAGVYAGHPSIAELLFEAARSG